MTYLPLALRSVTQVNLSTPIYGRQDLIPVYSDELLAKVYGDFDVVAGTPGQFSAMVDTLYKAQTEKRRVTAKNYPHPREWGALLSHFIYQIGAIQINSNLKLLEEYYALSVFDYLNPEKLNPVRLFFVLLMGIRYFDREALKKIVLAIEHIKPVGWRDPLPKQNLNFQFPNKDKLDTPESAYTLIYYYLIVTDKSHKFYAQYEINTGVRYLEMLLDLGLIHHRNMLGPDRFDATFSLLMLGQDITNPRMPAVESTAARIAAIEAEHTAKLPIAHSRTPSPTNLSSDFLEAINRLVASSSSSSSRSSTPTPEKTPVQPPSPTRFSPISSTSLAEAPVTLLSPMRLSQLAKTNSFFAISNYFATSASKIKSLGSTYCAIFEPRIRHFSNLIAALLRSDNEGLKLRVLIMSAAQQPEMANFQKKSRFNPLEQQKYYDFINTLTTISEANLLQDFNLYKAQLTAQRPYDLNLKIDIIRLGGLSLSEAQRLCHQLFQ